MGATDIAWTGTPLRAPLTLSRAVRLDGDAVLAAGLHPAGEALPGFTFNPWVGCEKISPACKHCYAAAWAKRAGYTADGRHRLSIWGPAATTPRVRTSATNWKRPHRWNRVARELGVRFKVFCASLADVGEDHPQVAPWRAELFDLIDATPHLDWLLLTKRPEVLGAAWPSRAGNFPPHVWVGATVEDQAQAEKRIPALLGIPAVVRFLSMEPLLGAVHIESSDMRDAAGNLLVPLQGIRVERIAPPYVGSRLVYGAPRISWVIIGGESGAGHRGLDLDEVESIAAQCAGVGTAVFVKQDSGPHPGQRGRLSDALWSLKQFPDVPRD